MDIVMNLLGAGPAPAVSFCGAVQWWKWCRQRPKSGFFRWLFRP